MAEKLSEYKRKRDPKETPEPFGSKKGKTKDPIFVVQRHAARSLHYDFRLERDGALLSWAVPKGVPLEPGEQHRFSVVEISNRASWWRVWVDGQAASRPADLPAREPPPA